jgi:CBS domain-containing protein
MKVRELMSKNLVYCGPDASLDEVARLMRDNDCGEIPIAEGSRSRTLIGVITDRDIVCRAVAEGKNPRELKARDCMSSPVLTVRANEDLEECCRIMEQSQIRRVPVVDEAGDCCGIVSQADVARIASDTRAGHVVKEVSRETRTSRFAH